MKLTSAHINQLLSYIAHRDNGHDGGWYFGNKAQFEKRHKEIQNILYEELVKRSDAASHRTSTEEK